MHDSVTDPELVRFPGLSGGSFEEASKDSGEGRLGSWTQDVGVLQARMTAQG